VIDIARIMSLDIGDSRIGVALSDPLGILATPLMIIDRINDESAIRKIVDIIISKEVSRVIAGLPLNMDSTRGEQAEKTDFFVIKLKSRTSIPVEYQDERLSTVSARELIRKVRKTNRATRYDAAAAALILQSYLDEAGQRTDRPEEMHLPAD
jgi:putative holliday junction resolvase